MTDYDALVASLRRIVDGERDPIANAANVAALLSRSIPDLNWAGFYFLHDDELVLGPFGGEPAVSRIAIGRGVCGTAIAEVRTIVVDDVHAFAGHIACDANSSSEIVVPLATASGEGSSAGRLVGVLDLDSPSPARFAAPVERAGIEALARAYVESCDWSHFPGSVARAESASRT